MKKLYLLCVLVGTFAILRAQTMTSYDLNPGTPGTTPVPQGAEWDAAANEPLLKFTAGSYYVEALVSELEAFRNGTVSLPDFWINHSIKLNSTTTGQPLQLFRVLLNFSDTRGLLVTQANTTTAKNYLYRTDGKGMLTGGQSSQLTLDDLILLDSVGTVRGYLIFRGKIVMSAEVPSRGQELVVLDSNYTASVMDIYPGSGSSGPRYLYNWGDSVLFFQATDGSAGIELWRSDSSGTTMVKDINSGAAGSEPEGFYAHGGKVYFFANDGTGEELWATNGTEAGTAKVKDLNSTTDANPRNFTSGPGGLLYFSAADDSGNRHLYKTDGTAAGTSIVTNTAITSGFSHPLQVLGGHLYFIGIPTGSTEAPSLYKTDGTAAGTSKFYQPYIGSTTGYGVSNSFKMATSNGYIYFTAHDSIHDYEIYRTDGTTAGTIRATDFAQATGGSNYPNYLTPIPGGGVFFFGRDSIIGSELRILDLGLGVGIVPAQLSVVGKVYPNPACDVIHIETNGTGLYEITLTNITGKLVAKVAENSMGKMVFHRPEAATQAGIYLLHIRTPQGESQTIKVVYY